MVNQRAFTRGGSSQEDDSLLREFGGKLVFAEAMADQFLHFDGDFNNFFGIFFFLL
jgi:hypothetical protein